MGCGCGRYREQSWHRTIYLNTLGSSGNSGPVKISTGVAHMDSLDKEISAGRSRMAS